MLVLNAKNFTNARDLAQKWQFLFETSERKHTRKVCNHLPCQLPVFARFLIPYSTEADEATPFFHLSILQPPIPRATLATLVGLVAEVVGLVRADRSGLCDLIHRRIHPSKSASPRFAPDPLPDSF